MLTTQEILLQSNIIEYKNPFLELYYDNPFTDAFLLQIIWNENEVLFFRNTLLKNSIKNSPKNQKKSQNIEFSCVIRKEKGTSKWQDIENLVQEIQKISLPFFLNCEVFGRDGHHYKLTFGDIFSSVTYDWYEVFVPDQWIVLNKISEKIYHIQDKWIFSLIDEYYFRYDIQDNAEATNDKFNNKNQDDYLTLSHWQKK